MLPTVADVLALDAVKRGAPRVIAAADRLGSQVRWVHVIELAEAGRLLRGGELVLSTGIALPADPDGLTRYVAGLAAAGVSALAVELGSRYITELPRALVAAATAHRLPLIVFERETQFIAITEAVHAQILDAQVAELRAAQRIDRVFTGLAAAGADQDEIVRQASVLAGAPAILADLSHRVLACDPAGGDAESLLAGFAARSRSVSVPERTGFDQDSGWLIATVGTRDANWGRLIFVLSGPPGPGLPALAERAATTLGLARLASAWPDRTPARAAHRSILGLIAGPGYADEADLAARIAGLGVPLAGRRLLPLAVRVRPAGPDADLPGSAAKAADALSAGCQDLALPAICGPLDNRRIAALLALPPGADVDQALGRLAARLRAGCRGLIEAIGAGPLVAGLDQVRAALREADEAAAAATALADQRPFVTMSDLHLSGLVYQLRRDPRMVAFVDREIGPLLGHDQRAGTDLVAILACYLRASGNKARAAALAGMARPTLYERLRQIEQVLGIRLADAQVIPGLHVALLALAQDRPPPP